MKTFTQFLNEQTGLNRFSIDVKGNLPATIDKLKQVGVKNVKIDGNQPLMSKYITITITDTLDNAGMKLYLEDENDVEIDFNDAKQFNKELDNYRI